MKQNNLLQEGTSTPHVDALVKQANSFLDGLEPLLIVVMEHQKSFCLTEEEVQRIREERWKLKTAIVLVQLALANQEQGEITEAAKSTLARARDECRLQMIGTESFLLTLNFQIQDNPAVSSTFKKIFASLNPKLVSYSPVVQEETPHTLSQFTVHADAGSVNRLCWQGATAAGTLFEIEAAIGQVHSFRGIMSPVDAKEYNFRTTVQANEFVHSVQNANGFPVPDGVPVRYRIRAVKNGIAENWLEPITVHCSPLQAEPAPPTGVKQKLWQHFFDIQDTSPEEATPRQKNNRATPNSLFHRAGSDKRTA